MPLCPTKGGLSVRFATLRLKFFRGCQYTQSSYLQEGAVHNGDIARGGKALALFSASSQHPKFSPKSVPSPSESCLRKGRLRTRCPGASSQVEPGCEAEGGASAQVAYGSISIELGLPRHGRFTPVSDRTADIAGGPVRAIKRHLHRSKRH